MIQINSPYYTEKQIGSDPFLRRSNFGIQKAFYCGMSHSPSKFQSCGEIMFSSNIKLYVRLYVQLLTKSTPLSFLKHQSLAPPFYVSLPLSTKVYFVPLEKNVVQFIVQLLTRISFPSSKVALFKALVLNTSYEVALFF